MLVNYPTLALKTGSLFDKSASAKSREKTNANVKMNSLMCCFLEKSDRSVSIERVFR